MELKELIKLLDSPEKLNAVLSEMRLRSDLTEEEQGFLVLYDHYNGNSAAIRTYLHQTKEYVLNAKKPIVRKLSFLKVAAIFILLFGTGIFFLMNRPVKTNAQEELAKESATFQEPGIPIFMGEESKIDWAQLMYAIDKESPQRALQEWRKIEKLEHENDTLIYFGGIVYQKLNKLAKARFLYEKNANSSSVFADRSAYFLLQIAKSRGDQKERDKWLEQLKNTQDLDLKPYASKELKK
jgi:hypothetical protein